MGRNVPVVQIDDVALVRWQRGDHGGQVRGSFDAIEGEACRVVGGLVEHASRYRLSACCQRRIIHKATLMIHASGHS
jgi:hypothetical protein